MPAPWTKQEKDRYHSELIELYVRQNKTIDEVGIVLNIKPQTVYDRLKRLEIPINKERKLKYLNRRSDIIIPQEYSEDMAEFFGVMLGDGNLTHFQVAVTLGTKERAYAEYVAELMGKIFGPQGTIMESARGHKTVYIGSTEITRWLQGEGLVFNKVKFQVDAPRWIFNQPVYMERFLRGFFDTDGSVYHLKFGIQISLTNFSAPLLISLQEMLTALDYNVSAISYHRLYVTRINDVRRFFREIAPQNPKHNERFEALITRYESESHR